MSAMSDGSPVSPELDARMLADLRAWRSNVTIDSTRWSMRLTIDELDMLLRRVADLEDLRREMIAEVDERVTLDSPFVADVPDEIRQRIGYVCINPVGSHSSRECGGIANYHSPECRDANA